MTTKLQLYKDALRLCGAASIATLADECEGRRLLDEAWDSGAVTKCLERGQWNFAIRTQMLDYDPSVSTSFGYQRAFLKADDWVTTTAICTDPYLRSPLLEYIDEASYIYADYDVLYVQFVSNDSAFGGDLSKWPGIFADYVAGFLASQVVHRLTSDKDRVAFLLGPDGSGEHKGYVAEKLGAAASMDAMDGPTVLLPAGSWVRSRSGRYAGRRDRGSRTRLIG